MAPIKLSLLCLLLTSVFGYHIFAASRSVSRCPNKIAKQWLDLHNNARVKKNLNPLSWSGVLASYAQWYTSQKLKDNCQNLQHSDSPFGENLFWGTGTDWTPQNAVNDWVSENKYYDDHKKRCNPDKVCGHYTQVMWNATTSVGCANFTCNGGQNTVMSCNYHPLGNIQGENPY